MLIRPILGICCFTLYVHAEIFSVVAGIAAVLGGVGFWSHQDKIRCKIYECCTDNYLTPNFEKMRTDLRDHVFGQHLVQIDLWNSIVAHWKNPEPVKALALAFLGPTGCGKNYVSRIIAENLYKKGLDSGFIYNFVATSDFPDKSRVSHYQDVLRNELLAAGKKCGRSIFIFDEVDKMPDRLLETLKPFMDYYDDVRGVDFRRSIFILLSNRGGDEIATTTLSHHRNGKDRSTLALDDFERLLMNKAFLEDGGMKRTDIIKNQLIDHYVPFLPLERRHVVLCIHQFLRSRFPKKAEELIKDPQIVNQVANSLQYFPADKPVFSSSGCKRVAAKTELAVFKLQPPSKTAGSHTEHDEDSI